MDKYAMVIRADARAMGAVTALRTGGTRRTRSNVRALSDVTVYNSREDYEAGNIARIIPRNTRSTSTVKRVPRSIMRDIPHRIMASDLPALNCD